jgi:hypothetical protein
VRKKRYRLWIYSRKLWMPRDMIPLRVRDGDLYAWDRKKEGMFSTYLAYQRERMEAVFDGIRLPAHFRLTTWKCFVRDVWPKRVEEAQEELLRRKRARREYGMHVLAWREHQERAERWAEHDATYAAIRGRYDEIATAYQEAQGGT